MKKLNLYSRIESLAHFFSGYNIIIGPHIRKQLKYLKEIVPAAFQQRQMDDLGCGDGKITVQLKDIFLPKSLRGFDVNPGLVRRAQSKGIQAEVRNLEEDMSTGELAVMWGVLHHLEDMEGCIKKLKENYSLIFIRDPLKEGGIKGLELGHPLRKGEIERLIEKQLADSQVFYYDNAIFIFYNSQG